jgi:hypothetical protein
VNISETNRGTANTTVYRRPDFRWADRADQPDHLAGSGYRHPFGPARRPSCVPEITQRPNPFRHDDPSCVTGSENRGTNRFTRGNSQVVYVNAEASTGSALLRRGLKYSG